MSARSIIYVDGMNLYFGMVKGTPYRWLDLQRMFERLRPGDDNFFGWQGWDDHEASCLVGRRDLVSRHA